MPDPITLAELREHIVRRIQECRERSKDIGFFRSERTEASAIANELTEILALLDRVQQGGTK
jgi:hypothetical protein